jgi:hypothetical protein
MDFTFIQPQVYPEFERQFSRPGNGKLPDFTLCCKGRIGLILAERNLSEYAPPTNVNRIGFIVPQMNHVDLQMAMTSEFI